MNSAVLNEAGKPSADQKHRTPGIFQRGPILSPHGVLNKAQREFC